MRAIPTTTRSATRKSVICLPPKIPPPVIASLDDQSDAANPRFTEEALLALRADQPVVTNPTQLLNLWNKNALDPTELIASLDRQEYGLVVLRAQFYPPPVLQAIGARYEPIDDIMMNGFQYRILGSARRLRRRLR